MGGSSVKVYRVEGEEYEKGRIVAFTSRGSIFAINNRKDKKTKILRVFRKHDLVVEDAVDWVMVLKTLLMSLRSSPFILSPTFAFQTEFELCLLFPLCSGGDLARHIGKARLFSKKVCEFIMGTMVIALEYLHTHSLIHRNVNPTNILFDQFGYCYLTGFTKFKVLEKKDDVGHKAVGSPLYQAPEMKKRETYQTGVDIWSLGVILYEITNSSLPELSEDFCEVNLSGFATGEYPLADLLQKMLQIDPKERISATEMKKHPFFSSFKWDDLYQKKLVPPYSPESFPLGSIDEFMPDEIEEKGISEDDQKLFASWDTGHLSDKIDETLPLIQQDLALFDNPVLLSKIGLNLQKDGEKEKKRISSLFEVPLFQTYVTEKGNRFRRVSPHLALLFTGEYDLKLDEEYSGKKQESSQTKEIHKKLGDIFELCVIHPAPSVGEGPRERRGEDRERLFTHEFGSDFSESPPSPSPIQNSPKKQIFEIEVELG